jgi:hypothetical protein
MDDKPNPGQPAQVPYKWANAHIKAMQGGNRLGGEKKAEAHDQGFVSADGRKDNGKADGEDQEGKAENLINQHVLGRVFRTPNGTRLTVYNGGKNYYSRDDSLQRARKSWADKDYKVSGDKPLKDK